jgi:hypothetical protein
MKENYAIIIKVAHSDMSCRLEVNKLHLRQPLFFTFNMVSRAFDMSVFRHVTRQLDQLPTHSTLCYLGLHTLCRHKRSTSSSVMGGANGDNCNLSFCQRILDTHLSKMADVFSMACIRSSGSCPLPVTSPPLCFRSSDLSVDKLYQTICSLIFTNLV